MNRIVLHLRCVVFILLCACGSTTLAWTGARYPPRSATCDFRVFTAPPGAGFIEIAAIDIEHGFGSNVRTAIGDLKKEIQPHVCRAGGDAALAHANGYGRYDKVTVLKVAQPPSARQDGSALKRSATKPECHSDAQCKGARICARGACVKP